MKKVMSFLIAAVLLVTCMATAVFADGAAVFTVSNVSGNVGDEVTVSVSLTNATIRAYQATLSYDAEALTLKTITQGDVNLGFFSSSVTTGTAGCMGSETVVDGVIFTATFEIKKCGTHTVSLTNTKLSDKNYGTVSHTVTNGSAAGAHTEADAVKENEKAATCTVDGSYDMVVYCSVCGEEVSRVTTTVTAPGHTEAEAVKENEKAATCTVDGSYDSVVYCSVCGEEVSRETVTVPATGHTEGDVVIENASEAACENGGSYDEVVYCTVCGEELSRNTVTITAPGHTEGEAVKENEKAATCTDDGSYDNVVYCSVCGEELSRETITVPATGHAHEAVTTPATCVDDGVITYTCANCGDVYTETIPATGHDYKYEVKWAEDYSSATFVATCSKCGDTFEIQATIEAVEHAGSCTEDYTVTITATAMIDNENSISDSIKLILEEAPGHVDEDADGLCDVCGNNAKTGDFTVIAAAAAAVISMTSIIALPIAKKKFF